MLVVVAVVFGQVKEVHSGVLEKKPEMKEKYFCIVEDEAQHLLALINRLLTISKLEHGKLSIQKAEIDLEAMIEDVVDKYKAKSAKPIHITTLFGATSALADEEYLKEAISNIGVSLAESGFSGELTVNDVKHILKKMYHSFDENYFIKQSENLKLPMNKKIKEFSTGMKAKLRVLTAMTHHAKLLIMDEPTAGLDVEARNEILVSVFFLSISFLIS